MRILKKDMLRAAKGAQWDTVRDRTMQFVADVDNTVYYEEQAKILIREAGTARLSGDADLYEDKLDQAMRMIVLAKLTQERGTIKS
jgi:hypothetical protein